MKNNKFFDFLTSIPFLMIILLIAAISFYMYCIKPHYDYVMNSEVVTKGSSIRLNKDGEGEFFLIANLYPEIKKKSSFQKEIPTIELQKAALRTEIKVLDNMKNFPSEPQPVFDTALWYIVSAGIKSDLQEVKDDRAARLLAGYYYLHIFNEMVPKHESTEGLARIIMKFIESKCTGDSTFCNYLTTEITKNLEVPPTELEQEQDLLLKESLTSKNKIESLEKLCTFYDDNINTYENSRKLGFILASKYCYQELKSLSDNDKTYNQTIKDLKEKLENFPYKI